MMLARQESKKIIYHEDFAGRMWNLGSFGIVQGFTDLFYDVKKE